MGVGHLRRFWPSTEALKQAIVAGEIGELLHVEGHFSNEHSNNVVGGWRESPAESPAAGLTGAGLHIVDAFTLLVGPALSVHAHVVERKPPPAPLDTIAARLKARAEKNWAEADRIRAELTAQGIVLEDGADGTTWRRV